MAIQPYTKRTFLNEDQRWIAPGGISAMKDADSVVLDRSGFDLVTAFPNGYLPSGLCLGKITATGLYVPYVTAAGDGTGVLAGHLLVAQVMLPTEAATADILAPLYWHGEVDESMLPTGHGLDATGKADVAGFIRYI